MLNASELKPALRAMASKGIKNAMRLAKALTERHAQIEHVFFKGVGLNLMYQDSIVAEKIMLSMLERGAAVLPVHDSFIVRNSYDSELEEIMVQVFEEQFGKTAKLKYKKTVLDEDQELKNKENKQDVLTFVTDDLEELLLLDSYKWYIDMWGL